MLCTINYISIETAKLKLFRSKKDSAAAKVMEPTNHSKHLGLDDVQICKPIIQDTVLDFIQLKYHIVEVGNCENI